MYSLNNIRTMFSSTNS